MFRCCHPSKTTAENNNMILFFRMGRHARRRFGTQKVLGDLTNRLGQDSKKEAEQQPTNQRGKQCAHFLSCPLWLLPCDQWEEDNFARNARYGRKIEIDAALAEVGPSPWPAYHHSEFAAVHFLIHDAVRGALRHHDGVDEVYDCLQTFDCTRIVDSNVFNAYSTLNFLERVTAAASEETAN